MPISRRYFPQTISVATFRLAMSEAATAAQEPALNRSRPTIPVQIGCIGFSITAKP
ncbi:MAG: hypothetical protein M3Y57_00820 [Acidobacteriota bacterium]|nr:hypothetical protein [Acidobacteriota bacterium]